LLGDDEGVGEDELGFAVCALSDNGKMREAMMAAVSRNAGFHKFGD
jgi:hypothetical protein